ncbi:uncharacterized protein LOC129314117 [Prosopis cineraria]|uniref:uncharacterized protein LOC129314117 n=1 Tax=Prosopis cineraria TaxID=364024 RepID=UPI00240F0CA5|nr:uncharacterized protein LOC129314117 [Prosopis cineraria]
MSSSSPFMDWPVKFVFRYTHIVLLIFFFLSSSSSSLPLHPLVGDNTTAYHRNFTAISEFRVLNRRILEDCSASSSPNYLQVNVTTNSSSSSSSKNGLSDDEFVTVTVSGVSQPSDDDWVAMISPSDSDVKACLSNWNLYLQTGDTAKLPLLCHYPVKVCPLSFSCLAFCGSFRSASALRG